MDEVEIAVGATTEAATVDVALAGAVGEAAAAVGVTPAALIDGKLQANISIETMDKIMRRRFFIVPPFVCSVS
jgi:hypothetical protein